ncbi:MAG: glycosyltransferase [Lachnospiraceae bacterium]|nr:glycosyltransferase [Lachnospiraceae bacterium]
MEKITFIMCTNNEAYLNECFNYLSLLNIPERFAIDTLVIPDAKSMTAGYNEGMNASDAKYKIYLHQDTFIRNQNFLSDIIEIFRRDASIGMIGTMGAVKLSSTGVMWNERRIGNFYRLNQMKEMEPELEIDILTEGLMEVEVVDGLLIATQYDIPWREDIFDGWDFYDVSQCLEFRRRGYQIVIPGQEKAWCIHDCGIPYIGDAYERYRRKLIAAYSEFFPPVKRFLYTVTDVVHSKHIPWGLIELGHEVCIEKKEVHIQEYDEQDKDDFAERLRDHYADYVITFDLSPEIAQACHEVGVPYIAWAWDSPLKELNGWFAMYPTTFAFSMDKKEMERMKAEGKGHAHLNYMHLAANVTQMSGLIITKEDEKKYRHDIALVASLYESAYYESYPRALSRPDIPKELKERTMRDIDEYLDKMVLNWHRDSSVFDLLPEETAEIIADARVDAFKSFNIPNRRFYEASLARIITHRDRVRVLKELSKLYDVHLYTWSKRCIPKKVIVHDPVNSYVDAPKVYHLSKINLNITLRSIETGVPLRIFEIMSVGGFVMSNYQKDLTELFVPDKEIVLFESMEELLEKVKYYLSHEKQRAKIALAGYNKVKRCYTYPQILEKMIKIVDESKNES